MRRAIGLMSGTSLDGIDAALIETDGEGAVSPVAGLTLAYENGQRALLRRALEAARTVDDRDARPGALAEAEAMITRRHAHVVAQLLEQVGLGAGDIDIVGFHGQTVLHRPERSLTVQLGDGAALARATGIAVVHDLRAADVAAGGEGAPLAPAYHRAIAAAAGLALPAAFLNIGGVGNITYIGEGDQLIAFDTGPGNALIDDWMQRETGRSLDEGGACARRGSVNEAVLAQLLDNPYFAMPPPKSLDRDDFSLEPLGELSVEDGAATLVAFTAASIARACALLPGAPGRFVLCGGGRHNPAIVAALEARLAGEVLAVDALGFDGDLVEAQAFAYFAVRSLDGLAITYPGTTGVPEPLTGGIYHGPAA